MLGDIKCPYCEKWQEINHDDGYGYEEDRLHQQECDCGKTFTFTTSISFDYEAFEADCLNDGDHQWVFRDSHIPEWRRMKCKTCEETRELTDEEKFALMCFHELHKA